MYTYFILIKKKNAARLETNAIKQIWNYINSMLVSQRLFILI